MHTSVGPHKSCGCKSCQKGLGKTLKKDLAKMKPITKIPAIKKWKGKQAFNKKVLIGKTQQYKWDRLCSNCIAKVPHDIDVHKHGIRMGVGHSGVAKMLGNEEKLHGGLGL